MTPYQQAEKLIEWLSPKEREALKDVILTYPPYSKEEVMRLRANGWKIGDWLYDREQYLKVMEPFRKDCRARMAAALGLKE